MANKVLKTDVIFSPNVMVTILGRDMGSIAANKVECILDYSMEETKKLVQDAYQYNKFIPLIADESKIKSVLIMDDKTVYPSTFRVTTLNERIRCATENPQTLLEE